MKPEKIKELLIGKTISDIKWHEYMWPMCVDEIHFTDGTIVELSGNADYARIESVENNNGHHTPYEKDL